VINKIGSQLADLGGGKETNAAAVEEMERYCETHPRGPAAVRKPRLFMRGNNFVVLLGRSVREGIAGFGSTVPAALRAFEQQYLKMLRPPCDSGLNL
jgi:hypothetical protein